MNFKRMISMLLALCLVLNMAIPGVSALNAGKNELVPGKGPEASEKSGEPIRITTLKNAVQAKPAADAEGKWTAEAVQVEADLPKAQLPQGVKELQEAAELYAADELVPAFIVLEEKPLAESGLQIQAVSADKEAKMLARQDKLIQTISNKVLHGKLDVRYQFTYLSNAVSANVPFGKLAEIAELEGVKTVFLMPVYDKCETVNTATAADMIGVPSIWEDLGYTGTGMKIAIVDTGLDLDHPSFAADPELNEDSLTVADIEKVLPKLNASELYPAASAENLYRSAKVPFAFNYVDESLKASHDYDQQGDHGSHVAGIAAANACEGTSVIGVAPDAQVVVMKVFGANGGAYQDDLMAAIEDALLLDVDVINMSLGASSGFSSEDPELDAIYGRVEYFDTILAISAGNDTQSSYSNIWGTDQNTTEHPDSAVVGSPSTWGGAISVASTENSHSFSTYFTIGGEGYGYTDALGLYTNFRSLAGQELEYVMVPGLGEAADFEGLDVEGKIAVISRGAINFSLKLFNAEQAGAVGAVIYNNEPGSIGLQMADEEGNLNDGISGNVPCVSVSQATGAAMAAAGNKVLTVSEEDGPVKSADGGQMSLFTSWGVTPSLELKPEITAIGGNMYSCYDNGQYGLMSGTSMAAPQLAGVAALVLQYLEDNYPDLADGEERDIAHALMMSTAEPVIAAASGLEASPRQQGAGLVNAAAALASEAYLSVQGQDKPKAELGDDPAKTGVYKFVFDLHNLSDEKQSYELDFSLLTEDVVDHGIEFMAGYERELTGEVLFSRDTVEVAPNGKTRVEATVKLSAEDKAWMDEHYANGIYVEGYVYAKNTAEEGVDLSLPFLGFYGDWTAAPILDEGFWYQNDFWGYENPNPTANQHFHAIWTNLAGTDWVLGFNPYTGMTLDASGNVVYDPANNVVSPNGDGVMDNVTEMYVSLMRNAKTLRFTYTDAETGEVYFEASHSYARKTSFTPAYGQIVPYLYTWYNDPWDFTGKDGKPLANNTRLNLTIAATGDYEVHTEDLDGDSIVIPMTVDTQAPELLELNSVSENGRNYLVLTVKENVNIADTFVANPSNTRVLAEQPNSVNNGDGTFTVKLDVTGLGNEMLLFLADFGANENAYKVTFEGDDNLPELTDGTLYAYRVMDVSYTDDSLYGWVAIDPETAEVTTLTSDVYEYYALTAAEYAGGYVFAVDAGYNLVAMVPGLWNRMEICNLGVKIADMTFDPTTNTMYMVGEVDYESQLLKLDLITGEWEIVCPLGGGTVYSIEYTDQGELYTIKGGSAQLWKMNFETMELEAVMDFTTGEYPYYSQSMTYDRANNCLYWAYCTYMAEGFAIYTIDLDTLTYTKTDFASQSEYVGLLMVEDTAKQTPCDGETCPSEQFADVLFPSWYHEGVDFVVENEYMMGVSDTAFAPADTVNRAMAVTVLYRMAGSPEVTGSHAFTDVQAGSFYENAVIWGVENAIVNGKSAASFAPNDAVTRQELATFLYRFAAYMGVDVTAEYDALSAFADAGSLAAYAVVPMKWAVGAGLVSGMDASHLAPAAQSNRAQLAVMLMRLYNELLGVYRIPQGELEGLKIAPGKVLMAVGGTQELTVTPDPWNAKLGEITFASTDENVATVDEKGVVTGIAGGECQIVAVCGELTANVPVRILDVQGTVKAYNYFSNTMQYGPWVTLDLADLSTVTYGEMSPVDFIAADYNGHENKIYGYDANYTFYAWDLENGDVQTIGSAGNSIQVTDMAYDYTTGIMYAVGVDTSTYMGNIYQVDVRTGKLVNAAMTIEGLAYFGLAIDLEGNIYVLDSESKLYSVTIEEGMDWMTGEPTRYAVEELLIDTGFGGLNYTQSMCYDYDNHQIIWAACGAYSTIYWMDPATGDFLDLGSPEGDMFFEFMGMHSIPSEIPELPVVALESADLADSLAVMVGGSKAAPLSLYPLNATIGAITWSSADERIATVDQSGNVTGVALGQTEITVSITVGEEVITDTMTVTVMESADNLYAYILTDFATMAGQVWAEVPDTAPETPNYLAMTDWCLEAAEYVNDPDGSYIYAYGYDPYSWEDTSRYLFTIDPETFEIVEMVNTGMDLFVYDMSYDYATGTMYALASYNNDGGADLYMVDLKSGKLIMTAMLDKFFMGIAFNKEGELYAIAESEMEEDPITWEVTVSDAGLYTIEPATGSYELVGYTGMKNNMYTSMAFDFDTGNLYWNTCYRMDFWSPVEAKFCVIDAETGVATDLGFLGTAGSQISALLTIADEYPEAPEAALSSIIIDEKLHVLGVGDTALVDPLLIHPACEAQVTYASSDEAVAVVDEDGTITAVGIGSAEITATATQGDVTVSDTCRVAVFAPDASLMAFENQTNTWSTIGRLDTSVVTAVSEEQESVLAAAYVGDTIYGFDAQHNFFKIEGDGFERTILGNTGLELGAMGEIGEDFLDLRGMAYDAANDRLLAMTAKCCLSDGWIDEYQASTVIYEVNLENGNLTELVTLSEDLFTVRGMAVDGEGNVFVYTAFDDYFSLVDLTTGGFTHKCTLQSLGVYGSSEHNMPMAYDAATGLVYCLLTGNGTFHNMMTFNPVSAQVQNLGEVGEVVYNEDTWMNEGPTFSVLLIK